MFQTCYPKVLNSTLTSEDILLRFRRDSANINRSLNNGVLDETIAVSSALNVLEKGSILGNYCVRIKNQKLFIE